MNNDFRNKIFRKNTSLWGAEAKSIFTKVGREGLEMIRLWWRPNNLLPILGLLHFYLV